jgi:hypothetical protein
MRQKPGGTNACIWSHARENFPRSFLVRTTTAGPYRPMMGQSWNYLGVCSAHFGSSTQYASEYQVLYVRRVYHECMKWTTIIQYIMKKDQLENLSRRELNRTSTSGGHHCEGVYYLQQHLAKCIGGWFVDVSERVMFQLRSISCWWIINIS